MTDYDGMELPDPTVEIIADVEFSLDEPRIAEIMALQSLFQLHEAVNEHVVGSMPPIYFNNAAGLLSMRSEYPQTWWIMAPESAFVSALERCIAGMNEARKRAGQPPDDVATKLLDQVFGQKNDD